MPSPARPTQPRSRSKVRAGWDLVRVVAPSRPFEERRRYSGLSANLRPTVEPNCRRARIDSGRERSTCVFARVREYVDDRVAHLTRCFQCAAVPALGPESSLPRQEVVDVACNANRKPAHAARQRGSVARFDNEVKMIALNGKVDDAKPRAVVACRPRESQPDCRENELATELGDARSQRHVHRLPLAMLWARAMRHSLPWTCLVTGVRSRSAPTRWKGECELRSAVGGARWVRRFRRVSRAGAVRLRVPIDADSRHLESGNSISQIGLCCVGSGAFLCGRRRESGSRCKRARL